MLPQGETSRLHQVDFTDEQVDQAIEFLIGFAEDRGQTASYSRVFASAGMRPPQDLHFAGEHELVTRFMKAIHERCLKRQLPPLDALVVHVEGPRKDFPGAGYFKVNGMPDPRSEHASADDVVQGWQAWDEQVQTCRRWGREHRREA